MVPAVPLVVLFVFGVADEVLDVVDKSFSLVGGPRHRKHVVDVHLFEVATDALALLSALGPRNLFVLFLFNFPLFFSLQMLAFLLHKVTISILANSLLQFSLKLKHLQLLVLLLGLPLNPNLVGARLARQLLGFGLLCLLAELLLLF